MTDKLVDMTNTNNPGTQEETLRTDHDGFWKDLINRFCYYLLERAVPELYEKADTTREPRSLDKEFTDVLNIGSSKKRKAPHFVDSVSEIPLKDGGCMCVLFHCEARHGYGGGNIAEQMNYYRCLIYARYRREPVALAIITGARRKKERLYEHSHFGTEIIYRYNNLVLAELDDEELKASDNPIDLALYAAKCALKAEEEIQKYKYLRTLLELLAERGWSKEDKRDLLLFLERIIDLQDEDLEQQYVEYRTQLTKEGKVMYIPLGERKLAEELRQQGMALGMEKGIKKGKEEMVRALLANGVPPEIIAKSANLPVERVRKFIN